MSLFWWKVFFFFFSPFLKRLSLQCCNFLNFWHCPIWPSLLVLEPSLAHDPPAIFSVPLLALWRHSLEKLLSYEIREKSCNSTGGWEEFLSYPIFWNHGLTAVLEETDHIRMRINTYHFIQQRSSILSFVAGRTHNGWDFGAELVQNQLEQSVLFQTLQ